ncbi:response regulator [Pseudomonas brassicacearum subsp. neoaurantiaca]|uniref:Response regulator n=2 Tax=Pseudomonas brassicacearum TaxID=930166 RepID=A0A7V8UFI1_9PSED|nr:response regulator [Pseudomonas brassicacearum]MBA1380607.1 response regulator [Pseudomonas brassicacearum subsp. neoaurantiaca]
MPNKALRIIIADTEHYHRMKLERLLNHRGYFCIAPVGSLEEFLTLVEYGSKPFDLILANADLASGSLDLTGFLRGNLQVRHSMIYNAPQALLESVPVAHPSCLQMTAVQLPDSAVLERLMTLIDPEANESAQPWLYACRRGLGS